MGNPGNPEQNDVVTLVDEDGVERGFMIAYVDDETVVCDSGGRLAHFTRAEFEALFEERER